PTYWGDQPIVEAPAYVGAVLIFLFLMALFLVHGRLKWWLLGGTLLSLLLSYGKNLGVLTDLFIDIVPLYNKFRAVSSIQVILELCIPVLGVFGLSRVLNRFEKEEEKLKALKITFGITAGLCIILLLGRSYLFDFTGANDALYQQAYGPEYMEAVKSDRMSLFSTDVWRSLILISISAVLIWTFLKGKITDHLLLTGFAVLILFDLVAVNTRYVNADVFQSASLIERPYRVNNADRAILKDSTHFRVFDLTTNSTRPSYFHNSINGYHAAKMRRYNELFDFHISKNNLEVLNMLNTKYIIGNDESGQTVVYDNPDANGNAWFISDIKWVESADEEIQALDSIDTRNTAVINRNQFGSYLKESEYQEFDVDSMASIKLKSYSPDTLVYEYSNSKDGFIVFSENFYPEGWISEIDEEEARHIRVNYVLRGMTVPAGDHTISFRFEPQVVRTGTQISLASSVIFVILLLGGVFWHYKQR
ncbi:MAG: hypothetical protein HKO90_05855, partial [Flavobacteriaceae bacterium]|nr:hypothetical protein [Flavobacteriaceae bacterium]